MPTPPERKNLDLAKYTRLLAHSLALARARSFDNGFSASDLLDWMVESLQERADMLEVGTAEAIKPHPQETGGEEYWKVLNEFHGCECGHEHPYKPETVAKIVSLAEAKGAEKEREKIERIIRGTMDGLEVQTNAEFIACDDLTTMILKAITPPTP